MRDFALVTEGVSDHAVLKNILLGFYKEQREPDLSLEQPDPQAAHHLGGWTLVLQYFREKKFRQAFQFNHHLIVQIDTDVAEQPGFNVPKQNQHGPVPLPVFVANVVDRLKGEIGEEDLATYNGRFIFAIGVDQLECWVLPLWFPDARGEQIANCTTRLGNCPQLREYLDARKHPWISADRKDARSYDLASRGYRKQTTLLADGPRSPSLRIFLEDLENRAIMLPPLE